MSNRSIFKDRREVAAVQTRAEVREHLLEHHGQQVSPGMLLNDLHDTHDSLHEMVSSHSHPVA